MSGTSCRSNRVKALLTAETVAIVAAIITERRSFMANRSEGTDKLVVSVDWSELKKKKTYVL